MSQDTGRTSPRVVELSLPGGPAAGWSNRKVAVASGVVLVVVLLLVAVFLIVQRRMARYDPAAAAHAKLGRYLGLPRAERDAVRVLAAAAGLDIQPVALLLSRTALRRACNAAPGAVVAAAEPAIQKINARPLSLNHAADATA